MILWTLLNLTFAFALPTPSDLPTDIPPSVFARPADIFGTRSIWSIIWSCLSTTFACTWVAVHTNIPGPKDSQWAVLCRRVAIMGYTLIAPEMVIAWAARQHWTARHLAKQYQGHGWTMAHGFFLGMGGFTLHDERGTALRILEPNELETLSKAKKIAWPSITEEEIQDRSKGDYLSKGVVLVQTGWFITQCIVRGAYGLAITELEVATLALAALSVVTYYLWWHKPLDVRCSFPVYLLQDDDENGRVDRKNVTSNPLASNRLSEPEPHPIPCEPTRGELHEDELQVASRSPICEENQILPTLPFAVAPDPEPNPRELHTSNSILAPPHNNSTATPGPNFTGIQRFSAFIKKQRQNGGTLLGLTYVFADMFISDTLHDSAPLRVPIFYAPDVADLSFSVIVTLSVAVIFGGIHCVAWSFHFPSLQEQFTWRISAASVSALPVPMLACVYYIRSDLLLLVLTAIYAVARIALLVLPLLALRAPPPSTFTEIQWASFFPHLG